MIYYNHFKKSAQQQEGGKLKQTALVAEEKAHQARAKGLSLCLGIFFPFSEGGRTRENSDIHLGNLLKH